MNDEEDAIDAWWHTTDQCILRHTTWSWENRKKMFSSQFFQKNSTKRSGDVELTDPTPNSWWSVSSSFMLIFNDDTFTKWVQSKNVRAWITCTRVRTRIRLALTLADGGGGGARLAKVRRMVSRRMQWADVCGVLDEVFKLHRTTRGVLSTRLLYRGQYFRETDKFLNSGYVSYNSWFIQCNSKAFLMHTLCGKTHVLRTRGPDNQGIGEIRSWMEALLFALGSLRPVVRHGEMR